MSLEYTRSDGTIERAASLEEARKVCTFLAGMSIEQAQAAAEFFQIGDEVLRPAETTAKADSKPEPETKTVAIEPAKNTGLRVTASAIEKTVPVIATQKEDKVDDLRLSIQESQAPFIQPVLEQPPVAASIKEVAIANPLVEIFSEKLPEDSEHIQESPPKPAQVTKKVHHNNSQVAPTSSPSVKELPTALESREATNRTLSPKSVAAEAPSLPQANLVKTITEPNPIKEMIIVDQPELTLGNPVEPDIIEYILRDEQPDEVNETAPDPIPYISQQEVELPLIDEANEFEPGTLPYISQQEVELPLIDEANDSEFSTILYTNELEQVPLLDDLVNELHEEAVLPIVSQNITEQTQTPNKEFSEPMIAAVIELEPDQQVRVDELVDQLEVIILPMVESESAITLNQVSEPLPAIELEELIELAEELFTLIGYQTENQAMDTKTLIRLVSQILPILKIAMAEADLEHEGTREAKRTPKHKSLANGLDGSITTLTRGIGMLILLRSFALMPKEFHYQV